MRIVSDVTGKSYPTVEDCLAAEVTEAYKAIEAAQKHYIELRNAFVKDYGYFHATFTNEEEQPIQGVSDLLNIIKTFIG